MARPTARSALSEPSINGPGTSPSRKSKKAVTVSKDFSSEGVADHDVFLLPGSDYQILGALTVLGAAIRLFRIYQPSSVVFDEVQYVSLQSALSNIR